MTGFNMELHLFFGLFYLALSLGMLHAQDQETESISKFAVDFFKSSVKSARPEENVVISPFSAAAALAMVLAGSSGSSRSEIASALGSSDSKSHAKRFSDINGDKTDYVLNSANGVFVEKTFRILPKYRQTIEGDFKANVTNVDFMNQPEQSRQLINSFVKDNTRNKIPELFEKGTLDSATRLAIVNALYFKADWAVPFETTKTKSEDFQLLNGQKKKALLMHMENKFFYAESRDLDAQLLEIPYKNRETSMLVILPKKRNAEGLRNLEAKLTSSQLNAARQDLFRRKVDVFLPKFKANLGGDILEVLANMGIKSIFSDSADLSGISGSRNLKVSKAVQKVFIEVDEKGTEAAASTGFGIMLLSAVIEPPEVPVFRADRPFLFLIRHSKTGSVLFMGRITDPQQ